MGRWNPILLRASDKQRRAARRKLREAAEAERVEIDRRVARAADRWNNPNLYGPTLIRLVEMGKVDVKNQVTHRFKLEDLGKAFEAMKEGVSLRSIVVP